MKPTPAQEMNLVRSIARTRLDIINQLHAAYGAEIVALKARVADRERRLVLVRRQLRLLPDSPLKEVALDITSLRRPLRRKRK